LIFEITSIAKVLYIFKKSDPLLTILLPFALRFAAWLPNSFKGAIDSLTSVTA
jgi:hypothetical protein